MIMDRDILSELTQIFREVFEDDSININRTTTATDVAGWGSLSHIEMIVAVEQHFGIKFMSLDLKKLDSVGDLIELIKAKLSA